MENKEKCIIGPIHLLVPMDDVDLRGAIKYNQIKTLSEVYIEVNRERISDIHKQMPADFKGRFIELGERYTVLPGFIDCHTHICFSGSRSRDFAMRNSGISYLEISKAGGGIWDTVSRTREANISELVDGIKVRSQALIEKGITTAEVKSGYGLSVEEELKMLEAIKVANESSSMNLISTCLAAHIIPKDFNEGAVKYLNLIVDELFPLLKEKKLTNRIDAFVEEEAFNEKNTEAYFKAAKDYGFDITVHADQFSVGGSKVAVKHRALSADHLEASGEEEINLLVGSETTCVALPGASIGLGCAFTPARKILDRGGKLAIASDWNPGSAPMGDLLTQASILATFEKLSNEEILAGITKRAAHALGLDDRGEILVGKRADLVFYETASYHEILYQQGRLKPSKTMIGGKFIEY